MLPIELLSERFKNEFKLRWPFSNSTLEIEWIRKGQILYLRPKGSSTELLWMCRVDKIPHQPEDTVKTLASALNLRDVWRCCFFEGQPIFLNRREGIMVRETDYLGVAFHLPKHHFTNFQQPQTCLLSAHEYVEAKLQIIKSDDTSDYNRARKWLSRYEDIWSLIEWDEKTRKEIIFLLRGLYWLFGDYEMPNYASLSLIRRERRKLVGFYSGSRFLKAPPILFEVMKQHFQLHHLDRRRIYYPASWSHLDGSFPSFRFSPPTAHEKIEALFLWREFLTGKLPTDEIEAILPSW